MLPGPLPLIATHTDNAAPRTLNEKKNSTHVISGKIRCTSRAKKFDNTKSYQTPYSIDMYMYMEGDVVCP